MSWDRGFMPTQSKGTQTQMGLGGGTDSPAGWREDAQECRGERGLGPDILIQPSLQTVIGRSNSADGLLAFFYHFPNLTPKLALFPGRFGSVAAKGPPKAQIITFLFCFVFFKAYQFCI